MEKRIKDETHEVLIFNLRISKKQLILLGIVLTIIVIAGVLVFVLKHS